MKTKQRTCRVCGCTDNDCRQCIKKTGVPCYWVEKDLCSACITEANDESLVKLGAFNKSLQKIFDKHLI